MAVNPRSDLLLIDDNQESILDLARLLKSSGLGCATHIACTAEKALELVKQCKPGVVVQDLCLDENVGPQSGLDLLSQILEFDPSVRIIVLTGYGSVEYGVACLQQGASNFLEKPPNVGHLVELIKDGFRQADLMRSYQKLNAKSENLREYGIIGSSTAMLEVEKALLYASQTNQAVLISGETGSGKGLCAQAIHRMSKRRDKNFVRYQPCFASADLINSELFGHTKGSFTGAQNDRAGLIAEAHQGTLFLDEVDEIPAHTQVSLLGVLQEKRYRALGSNQDSISDFRLIAATNTDLDRALHDGKLRSDFYHRIAHLRIELPALRTRKEDIPELTSYFLNQLRQSEKVNVLNISEKALSFLVQHDWPGNVRELHSTISGAAYRAQFESRATIEPEHINIASAAREKIDASSFHQQVERFKFNIIKDALAKNENNQVQAAKALEMDRSSLRRILKRGSAKLR